MLHQKNNGFIDSFLNFKLRYFNFRPILISAFYFYNLPPEMILSPPKIFHELLFIC
jgi:hypothetical protein